MVAIRACERRLVSFSEKLGSAFSILEYFSRSYQTTMNEHPSVSFRRLHGVRDVRH
jgi:hypothetical protein